jgi:hypothetical protein
MIHLGRHDQTCNEFKYGRRYIYALLTSSGYQGYAMRNSGPALGSWHHVTCLIRQVCDVNLKSTLRRKRRVKEHIALAVKL